MSSVIRDVDGEPNEPPRTKQEVEHLIWKCIVFIFVLLYSENIAIWYANFIININTVSMNCKIMLSNILYLLIKSLSRVHVEVDLPSCLSTKYVGASH